MKYFMMAILFMSVGCSRNHGEIMRILEAEGCENVVDHGADIIFDGCSDSDFYNNQFSCRKNGRAVTGVVCSGLISKGATIRYY
jgi:hypothetical protein